MASLPLRDNRSTNTNGSTALAPTAKQLAFNVPPTLDTRVYLHITNHSKSLLVFIATSTIDTPATTASVGSFVYALPNSAAPASQPLSTILYSRTSSQDFMTRLAKILAKKLSKPVYVGGELRFWAAEDEAAALKSAVEAVMAAVKDESKISTEGS